MIIEPEKRQLHLNIIFSRCSYVKYTATTLEKDYKRDINCDSDMGMKLDLLTLRNYPPVASGSFSARKLFFKS